jgi:type I restriction enzyme R subunit
VIADEAHSSQTGEAASKLRAVLSAEEQKDLADGGEIDTQDIMLQAQMSARANATGITYIAFTATPKAKTIELFGTRPNPDAPASESNKPAPFHVYSMRQAIEEGFILDVLRNYTPYKLAFRLATEGREIDETEVERNEALKHIMRWVRLHPHNVAQKVQVVVEHFRENVAPLLDGNAKAMVVVGSRVEAVRWQIAIDRYIRQRGYRIGTLVAFSGEVDDPGSGPEPFSENSRTLNPGLRGRDLREAFGTDEYQILLVANKFQTGFDQPLLCGMYVDRRLGGIQAVQTLSRLNRAYRGKDTTYVLDFVNDPQEILEAFRTYYETAELSDVIDPNLIFDLRQKLDGLGYYDNNEVDRVVAAEMRENASQAELLAAIEPVADRLLRTFRAARERLGAASAGDDAEAGKARDEMEALRAFKGDLGVYLRAYAFLGQIFDYGNTEIEKRAIFFRRLLPLLEFGREREGVDLSQVELTHHRLRALGRQNLSLAGGERPKLEPMTDVGTHQVREPAREQLGEIIARVNDLFGGEASENDKLAYVNHVKGKLLESDVLVRQAASNTREQFSSSPDLGKALLNAIIDAFAAHTELSKQALDSESVRAGMKDLLLGPARLYDALREKAEISSTGPG